MVFSSVIFLFLFLPATLALYFVFPPRDAQRVAAGPELRLLLLGRAVVDSGDAHVDGRRLLLRIGDRQRSQRRAVRRNRSSYRQTSLVPDLRKRLSRRRS